MNVKISIQELQIALKNIVRCDVSDTFFIERIASLHTAGSSDMVVILDRGDASVFQSLTFKEIAESRAGIFLAQEAIVPGKRYLVVEDVLAAFTHITDFLNRRSAQSLPEARIDPEAVVHASAVVERGASIGAGAVIGAQVFVGRNCAIGNKAIVHAGAKILDECRVGSSSIIHAGAVIGSDGFGYQVNKAGVRKIPQVGIVRVGNNVEIGANCMIDRAAFDETVIGDGVKMDNGVHIAHNVIIGAGTIILAQTGIAGSVKIGVGCQIGGQVAIKDHVTIGNGVKIVSKSGVMGNLDDGQVVAGIPAIPFTQWKRLTVVMQRLPDMLKQLSVSNSFNVASKSWWRRIFT